jgi:hypothetical protein
MLAPGRMMPSKPKDAPRGNGALRAAASAPRSPTDDPDGQTDDPDVETDEPDEEERGFFRGMRQFFGFGGDESEE